MCPRARLADVPEGSHGAARGSILRADPLGVRIEGLTVRETGLDVRAKGLAVREMGLEVPEMGHDLRVRPPRGTAFVGQRARKGARCSARRARCSARRARCTAKTPDAHSFHADIQFWHGEIHVEVARAGLVCERSQRSRGVTAGGAGAGRHPTVQGRKSCDPRAMEPGTRAEPIPPSAFRPCVSGRWDQLERVSRLTTGAADPDLRARGA